MHRVSRRSPSVKPATFRSSVIVVFVNAGGGHDRCTLVVVGHESSEEQPRSWPTSSVHEAYHLRRVLASGSILKDTPSMMYLDLSRVPLVVRLRCCGDDFPCRGRTLRTSPQFLAISRDRADCPQHLRWSLA